MKAVICRKYGDPGVLEMVEVPKPTPKDNEILVKIFATTVHVGDTRIRKADPFLLRFMFGLFKLRKNLILGMEFSGEIEAIGKNIKSFRVGDRVFAYTGFKFGGYAEYICLSEKSKSFSKNGLLALKPENLSFEEAATVPAGGLTALKNLQKANISKGKKILVNGASGSLGTFAIQLAKYYGAEVTAVCSEKNFELVKSIGADRVIDYTKEDFTERNEKYNIVYDAVMKSSRTECNRILNEEGVFLNNSQLSKTEERYLLLLKDLIECGKIKPVIDRVYSIEQIIEAHEYVDRGHKIGNVVVQIFDRELK